MILFPSVSWQAVVAQLKSAKHVLLTTHRNPDADGVGSQLALYHALTAMGLEVSMFNRDAIPRTCHYLPGAAMIGSGSLPDMTLIDTIIALDAGSKSRLGFPELFFSGKKLVNIDHHASNPSYGDINLVDADYCATGAMMYDLLQALAQPLSAASASAIYAAVLTDTASFQRGRVGADVHRMVAELIEAGAKPTEAADEIYDSQPLARIALLTEVLQTLTIKHEGRSAWMHVDTAMIEATAASYEDTEGFIDMGRSIAGVEVAVFVRPEAEGCWKVCFRSKVDHDVGAVAASLGGGGHRYASGCTVQGSLDEVYEKAMTAVDVLFTI